MQTIAAHLEWDTGEFLYASSSHPIKCFDGWLHATLWILDFGLWTLDFGKISAEKKRVVWELGRE
ncbi:MAG: hypothetical protein CMM01_07690 [Rhodopirellula sp.]|nr:hypothetical protein [Rhodopirellula sp.]